MVKSKKKTPRSTTRRKSAPEKVKTLRGPGRPRKTVATPVETPVETVEPEIDIFAKNSVIIAAAGEIPNRYVPIDTEIEKNLNERNRKYGSLAMNHDFNNFLLFYQGAEWMPPAKAINIFTQLMQFGYIKDIETTPPISEKVKTDDTESIDKEIPDILEIEEEEEWLDDDK